MGCSTSIPKNARALGKIDALARTNLPAMRVIDENSLGTCFSNDCLAADASIYALFFKIKNL